MKILNAIKEHFGDGDVFTYQDLAHKSGIYDKVCAMHLKRLYNNCRIGGFSRSSCMYSEMRYFYWDLETANKKVEEENARMDKYDVRLKRLKPHKK